MKKLLLLAVTLFIATSALAGVTPVVPGMPEGMAAPAQRAEISGFYFDTTNDDWQMAYMGLPPGNPGYEVLYTNEPALWSSTLGDPIGSVYQTVSEDRDQRAYWLGYYGENGFMGDVNGRTLQCNVYSTGNWTTISADNGAMGDDDGNVYARWVVSRESDAGGTQGMFISRSGVSLDMNSFSGWETFAITIDENDFFRWPNNADPTIPSYQTIMSDYDQIGLYIFSGTDDLNDVNGGGTSWFMDNGTYRLQHFGANAISGDATWAIDNVTQGDGVVVTESATFDGIKALYR